jgi:hypothetical protein
MWLIGITSCFANQTCSSRPASGNSGRKSGCSDFSPSTAWSSPASSIWMIGLPAGARLVVSLNSATWASSNVTQSIESRSTP